jgi:phosphoglycolate phosphatase-like HAD superfamily hydrolase
MRKMKNIYLDMDGVIADFDKRYQELFNITTKQAERDKKWVQFFDKFIQDRHFATLDLMPEAIELMDYLKGTGIPITILSSTSSEKRDGEIRPQKMEWLKKHKIDFPVILVPGAHLKKDYATPDSILIDDTSKNIDDWRREGGVGILYEDLLHTRIMMSMYT